MAPRSMGRHGTPIGPLRAPFADSPLPHSRSPAPCRGPAVRTSWGTFLSRAQDEVVFNVEHRVAAWSHIPVENAEDMQVLKYQFNQTVRVCVGGVLWAVRCRIGVGSLTASQRRHVAPGGMTPAGLISRLCLPSSNVVILLLPPEVQYGAHWDDLDLNENPEGLGGGSVRVATLLIYLTGVCGVVCVGGGGSACASQGTVAQGPPPARPPMPAHAHHHDASTSCPPAWVAAMLRRDALCRTAHTPRSPPRSPHHHPAPPPPPPADTEEGGETAFPHSRFLDKEAQTAGEAWSPCATDVVAAKPRKGAAVFFWDTKVGSMRQDKWSMHTGCPVIKGTKW